MFQIKLKNNKTFTCDKDPTIFEAIMMNLNKLTNKKAEETWLK
jgi:hypothetical protein